MFALSESFTVQAATGPYTVTVESHAFPRFLAEAATSTVLADAFFQPAFQQSGTPALFVPALESTKSLDAAPALIEQLRRAGANRQTHLLALGGGIVQDLSAFIASIYMRGIPWTYIPSTILAMVDSCIGGKSSINVGPYKNLVGTFHPPQAILIDPALAQTLPPEQRASGLIEAAKICFCRGADAFERFLAHQPSIHLSTDALQAIILESLHAKKWFIEIDEFDQKERLLLNFGHTFGHALEGASHYAIPHGIAVGLGIGCSLAFQRGRGIDYRHAPFVSLLETHLRSLILAIPNLPETLQALSLDQVLERFASDKKHAPGTYTLILVAANGQVVLEKLPRSPALDAALKQAIQITLNSFGSLPQ